MSARRAALWILLFAALGTAGGGLLSCGGAGPAFGPNQTLRGTVTRVVDGDTVHVRLDGRDQTVRYIGIDTPESVKPGTPVQCFAQAASAYNKRLVAGRAVVLRTGAESRDRYGRLLAYVYRRRDGLFVNAALVRAGFATILTIPPNVAHAGQFLALERAARRLGRGLWHACR
jgi:micrococcal nuclease